MPACSGAAVQPHRSMFSAIYFFNLRGDILIQRLYRDDIECARCSSLLCHLRHLC